MLTLKFLNFYFDEKDIFILGLGIFLILAKILNISVYPFRYASLLVLWIFLMISRGLISGLKFKGYFLITFLGLLFSLFLSPYGLAIYLFFSYIALQKTNLIDI